MPVLAIQSPCPLWCQRPAGHDHDPAACDPIDGSRYTRHRADAGLGVEVEQLVITTTDGAREAFPPVVLLGDREHTAEQAHRMAAVLTRAASLAGGR